MDHPSPPASNNEEEKPDIAANTPTEINETAETPDTFIQPQPATEQDMEVHHHSHSHGKPTWKSRIWEFIMLFLAVFCGFLAEWELEHVVEKSREKTFVRSLVDDIHIDIQNINKLSTQHGVILRRLDSVGIILINPETKNDSYRLYRLWRGTFVFPDFVPNDGTISQLLSSGGLRLITKRRVVDAITAYQREVAAVKIHQGVMNDLITLDRKHFQLFNYTALRGAVSTEKIPLLTGDQEIMSWANHQVVQWTEVVNHLNKRLKLIQTEANVLLKAVSEEYGIE